MKPIKPSQKVFFAFLQARASREVGTVVAQIDLDGEVLVVVSLEGPLESLINLKNTSGYLSHASLLTQCTYWSSILAKYFF